jgi:hypothetical protein
MHTATLAAACVVVLTATLVAAYFLARRAPRPDPIAALRAEQLSGSDECGAVAYGRVRLTTDRSYRAPFDGPANLCNGRVKPV